MLASKSIFAAVLAAIAFTGVHAEGEAEHPEARGYGAATPGYGGGAVYSGANPYAGWWKRDDDVDHLARRAENLSPRSMGDLVSRDVSGLCYCTLDACIADYSTYVNWPQDWHGQCWRPAARRDLADESVTRKRSQPVQPRDVAGTCSCSLDACIADYQNYVSWPQDWHGQCWRPAARRDLADESVTRKRSQPVQPRDVSGLCYCSLDACIADYSTYVNWPKDWHGNCWRPTRRDLSADGAESETL